MNKAIQELQDEITKLHTRDIEICNQFNNKELTKREATIMRKGIKTLTDSYLAAITLLQNKMIMNREM